MNGCAPLELERQGPFAFYRVILQSCYMPRVLSDETSHVSLSPLACDEWEGQVHAFAVDLTRKNTSFSYIFKCLITYMTSSRIMASVELSLSNISCATKCHVSHKILECSTYNCNIHLSSFTKYVTKITLIARKKLYVYIFDFLAYIYI